MVVRDVRAQKPRQQIREFRNVKQDKIVGKARGGCKMSQTGLTLAAVQAMTCEDENEREQSRVSKMAKRFSEQERTRS